MKICIHRGTKEIGGTSVEIESKGRRIILDIGLPLNSSPEEVGSYDMDGFHRMDSSLLGIFVSHPHVSRYGLAKKLKSGAPIYIDPEAKKIVNAAQLFVPGGLEVTASKDLKHQTPIQVGPFTVTPHLVDHSIYDAYGFMVKADNKSLYYSGDFRGNGRKGKQFKALIKHPPRDVDVLLMEGPTMGREDSGFSYPTEDDLLKQIRHILEQTKSAAYFWCSGHNIDRLVTAYKACRRTGRFFVVDMYTACKLVAIGDPKLPQPGWHGFKVYLPRVQKKIIMENQLFDVAKSFSDSRIYPEKLKDIANKSLFLFRPSMRFEFEKAGCFNDAALIFSMWPGRLEEDHNKPLKKWLKRKKIPLIHCHTSDHAPLHNLEQLSEAISPKQMVPLHTFKSGKYRGRFKNVQVQDDGVWWEI
jgi:ribonuclease J